MRLHWPRLVMAGLSALFLVAGPVAHGAVDYLIFIQGVPGESTVPGRMNWIDSQGVGAQVTTERLQGGGIRRFFWADANAAIFDVANGFAGCIPGIHEVLRRQGLLQGTWCIDPRETLSPGQAAEIDRVMRSHTGIIDDARD
jgi:hypothetical protein